MDAGLEFESKMQMFDDLKVYWARDIMHLCGYSKWERFHGAIIRAVESQANEKFIEKNFFFITHQTAGRPKEDVLMTIEWVAQVLDKCDERKEEVNALQTYIRQVLDEKRNMLFQTTPISKSTRRHGIFGLLLLGGIIISLGCYYYFFVKLYHDYTKTQQTSYRKDIRAKDVLEETKKQEDIDKNNFAILDEEIRQTDLNTTIGSWQTMTGLSWTTLTGKTQAQTTHTGVTQTWATQWINTIIPHNAQEVALSNFFGFWNEGKYREACGMMSKKLCNSGAINLTSFENFWKNTKDWVKLLSLKQSTKDSNVYCVSYSYHLKYDTSPDRITETFHFMMSDDDFPVITGRYCESVKKWDRVRPCPVKTKNLHCVE